MTGRGGVLEQLERERDLAFLELLRSVDADAIDRLVWESGTRPKWQQVALARAAARIGVAP